MLFNSYIFVLLFLPIVLILYFVLNKIKKYAAAKAFLIIASLFFYGYVTPKYVIIIISSVLVNFLCGRLFFLFSSGGKDKCRKIVFAIALFLNIGILFYFKYYDFFIDNINALFKSSLPLLNLVLPLGISFFTFQQISYIVDCYKGDAPKYSFIDYALFVTYFPQLIAGPIVLHNEIIPQFNDLGKKKFNTDNFAEGIWTFSIGLGKKVLLADIFGLCVDYAFGNIDGLGTTNALIAMLAYTFQIYFDFSGYSDMAIGIGRMMNISIVQNFDSPYKAVNIVDFWKRWHITLTRFFSTYIYIPLGGSRNGKLKTYRNILIVFLLSGIWHGANWTFIVWGILHGVANVLTRIINEKTDFFKGKTKVSRIVSCCITFLVVNLLWVIFRSDSLNESLLFFRQLFSFRFTPVADEILTAFQTDIIKFFAFFIPVLGNILLKYSIVLFFVLAFIVVFLCKNANQSSENFMPTVIKSIRTAVILFLCITSFAGVSSFLYWNF